MKLQNGINLGGYLSQCEHSEIHYKSFIDENDILAISSCGFDHVRVPIDCEVLEQEDGSVKEQGYAILERLIEWCERHGLEIILDLHKAYGYDFNEAGNTEKNSLFLNRGLQDRFISLWRNLAERFGKKKHIAFELLNETVETQYIKNWNELISETVTAIRSITRDTTIIYGGVQWNSAKTLRFLEKPIDTNIIFTFHFYEPLVFTHQKAYWVPELDTDETIIYPETMLYYRQKSKNLGTRAKDIVDARTDMMGIQFIEEFLKDAFEIAEKFGVRLYCGEYGVIDQAPVEDTLRWFSDVNLVLETHSVGHCIWNYKSKDFGLFDAHYNAIRKKLLNQR